MKLLTIRLSDEQHKAIKQDALDADKSIKEYVLSYLPVSKPATVFETSMAEVISEPVRIAEPKRDYKKYLKPTAKK